MNTIVQLLTEIFPRERAQRVRKIWLLAALAAVTLMLSFGLLLLLMRLQGLLSRPLEDYALYAYVGAFVITALNSSTIIFPGPGMALVVAAASRWDPVWIAVAASIGGSLGEITGYVIGRAGKNVIIPEHSALYQKGENWMRSHGGWVVTFLAGVPLTPFDVVGIVAGGLRFPVAKFLLFCWLGRLPRSFVEVFFGASLLKYLFDVLR